VLNFAPMQISGRNGVKLKSVDVRISLESLSFYLKNVEDGTCPRDDAGTRHKARESGERSGLACLSHRTKRS
jgi:hypothetical protein